MVGGHYSLANWYDHHGNRREFSCRTTRVSPFRMLVSVPVVGKVGERVVSYFGDFGKLEGHISDTTAGGMQAEIDGRDLRIGIVQARFNEGITNSLAQACIGLKDQKGATAAMEKAAQDPETAAKAKAWLKSPTVSK